jgi:hypothetical protein
VESGFRDYGFPVKTSSQVLSKGPDSLVEISSVLPPLLTVPAIGVPHSGKVEPGKGCSCGNNQKKEQPQKCSSQ